MAETMSLREGAAYLGIGYDRFCALVRLEHIASVEIPQGTYRRVTKAAIDAFIEANTRGPIAGPNALSHSPEVTGTKGHLTVVRRNTETPKRQWMQRYAGK